MKRRVYRALILGVAVTVAGEAVAAEEKPAQAAEAGAAEAA